MSISERIAGAALGTILLASLPAAAADRSAVVIPVPGQPYFVQLRPMFVPVLGTSGNTISHQVSIALAIEIADGAHVKDVEDKSPELDNAFLGDIYTYVQQRGGIGDVGGEAALKDLLRTTAARVLAPVEVKEVEIEEFFEQQQ
jgi:flagellar basal body-associated protein FliL